MHPYILIGAALLADSLAGLAGGLLSEGWLSRHISGLVSFAAGALLSAVFLDILPEAMVTFGMRALPWMFCSFLAFAVLEWFLGHHHHGHGGHSHSAKVHEGEHKHEPPRVIPSGLLFADALHNLSDGAAVTAAFLVSPKAGLVAALAVIAHEVPQEVGDYALLRAAGFAKARALIVLAGVQLTAVVGAAIMIATAQLVHSVVGGVLAVSAGSFFYIGATDLLPEIHTGHSPEDRRERMGGFLVGVVLIAVVTLTLR